MDFNQDGHSVAAGLRFEFLHLRNGQRGGDEQDAVGPHYARFGDLVTVDDEVLAQHRQRASGPGGRQKLRGTLEILTVGKDRKAGSAMLRIAVCDLGGAEIRADHPIRRTGLLDFGDYRRLTAADLFPDGANKITRRRLHGSGGLDLDQRRRRPCGGDFLALGRDDLVKNVAHANRFVQPTNSSTLARAAPEAIISKAFSTPSASVAAWPQT